MAMHAEKQKQSMIRNCVICQTEVNVAKGIFTRHTALHGCKEDGHYAHNRCLSRCLDATQDIVCLACNPDKISKPLPPVEEPDVPNVRPGVVSKISAAISPLVNFNRDREDITDPVALIRLGRDVVPIDWLLREKKV